jgi:hypothetical protein
MPTEHSFLFLTALPNRTALYFLSIHSTALGVVTDLQLDMCITASKRPNDMGMAAVLWAAHHGMLAGSQQCDMPQGALSNNHMQR